MQKRETPLRKKVKGFTKVLSQIEKISERIIRTAFPLLERLDSSDEDLVEALIYNFNDLKSEEALKILQKAALDMIHDAEKVTNETKLIELEDQGMFAVRFDECPFLAEVWSGDVYDKTGAEGFQALLEDLTKQLMNVTEEGLIARAIITITENRRLSEAKID